jgi:redox-sensitive bicupin YhaK (pirin superfamily)
MRHRDHLGNEGHLRAGSVQWMTAAHGIIHSEMPEQENGLLHGFQLWINLPAKDKMKPPHYQEFTAAQIPEVDLENGGIIKVIAGDYCAGAQKITGPVKGVATQPIYCDVLLGQQQQLNIPIEPQQTALIYLYEGELHFSGSDKTLTAGQLGQLIDGNEIGVFAREMPSRFLLLAAMPSKEPVVHSGPFVMNSKEEIEQAYLDYRNGVLTRMDFSENSF